MKVLFLDIDGVCNSEASFRKDPHQHFPIDPYMAFLVGKIVLDTGCKVVLSSSWRHHDESVAEIEKRIVPILDRTPTMPRPIDTGAEYCERGKEIKAWMEKWSSNTFQWHVEHGSPSLPHILNESITAYAILDDDSDMLPEQQESFFKTSWKVGLTDEIAQAVINHLNK